MKYSYLSIIILVKMQKNIRAVRMFFCVFPHKLLSDHV
jgi:hypothetical protein